MRNMKTTLIVILVAAIFAAACACHAAEWDNVDPSYKHASADAYERWRDLKYGIRIHWGVYSMLGVEASWPFRVMSNQKKQEYAELYKKFNPDEFDAEKWMAFFERCGFKAFAFTTKHHDGFSMFDTKTRVTRRINWTAPGGPAVEDCDLSYSIMETPFHRDIVKELVDSGHKHNMAIDLYFSHPDWYDADFRFDEWNMAPDRERYNRKTDPEGYARFVRRHREQIRELLTNYGKIDMLCLDMYLPDFCWPDVKDTVMMARQLQPDVLMRDRGIGAYGDYTTPENWIPPSEGLTDKRVERPWMVIHTMARVFAYEPDGSRYKSGEWVLSSLIDIVAKGGNFMIGIGPDAKANFHPVAVKNLEYVGDWLKVNGEAIYGTRPWVEWKDGSDIRFTRSKNERYAYAIALRWPGKTLTLKKVTPAPGSAIHMLGLDQPLAWHGTIAGTVIELPAALQAEARRPCKQAYAFRIEPTADSQLKPLARESGK
jgi:alpha-L-fucosidase